MAKEAMSKLLYGVHPGVATVEKWISELPDNTGRSLEEWIALAKKEGPKEDKARREWLKTKHRLGDEQCLVDFGACGRQGCGGRFAGGVLENGGTVRGGTVRGREREIAVGL